MGLELKPNGLDKWGKPRSPFKFTSRGWACGYCGGLFRGLTSLTAHQNDMHATTPEVTEYDGKDMA